MEEQNLYAADTVQRLYKLLSDQFGDTYTVFPAFPLTPPIKDEMPCLIIDRKTDGATLGPTQTDDVTEVIEVWTIRSLADIVGSANPRTDGKREVELFVQGQDPTTLDYRADTLYYLLRHYLTMLQETGLVWIINSNIQTAYETGTLQDGITNCVFAMTRITTQRRVTVQNRQ